MCRHVGLLVCFACLALSGTRATAHELTTTSKEPQHCVNLKNLLERVCGKGSDVLGDAEHYFRDFCHSCGDFWSSENATESSTPTKSLSSREWLYGGLSVLVISVCGLCAVAVIPVLPAHIFQPAVQFLVALAVGSLTGDAVLHLLPHAFIGDHHEHQGGVSGEIHGEAESVVVWKGVVVLLVVTFFFVVERMLNIFSERRRRNHLTKQAAKVKKLVDESSHMVGEKLCKKNHHNHRHSGNLEKFELESLPLKNEQSQKESQESSCTEWQGLLVGKPLIDCRSHEICDGGESLNLENVVKIQPKDAVHPEDTLSVVIAEHHTSHHGHSHSHAHVHARPGSVASLAWLVLAGDGLHNLADGLAMGAAYAVNTTTGLTTTIAVLCHELPHELGDFAVLLRAGMTVKQAIVCNLFSSFLCLLGVLVGLGLGSANSVGPWIFASTAGMFLYIALVDMVPELNVEVNDGKSHWRRLLTQVAGLLTGFGIMLLIALYEHDIRHLLE